jgi:hypothetical protein
MVRGGGGFRIVSADRKQDNLSIVSWMESCRTKLTDIIMSKHQLLPNSIFATKARIKPDSILLHSLPEDRPFDSTNQTSLLPLLTKLDLLPLFHFQDLFI